jgi:OmpA-OmpF porin, OOP family
MRALAAVVVVAAAAVAGCASKGAAPAAEPASPAASSSEAQPASASSSAESPATATEFKLDGMELVLPSPVAFEGDSSVLAADAEPALEHIRAYLEAKPYITTVRIEGHHPDGLVSEQRAIVVARWLVEHGVDCNRLLPVGFGATKPIAAAGDAANTRIAVVNAALRGREIGGMPADGGGQVAGSACK